jgi:hypothetical protein
MPGVPQSPAELRAQLKDQLAFIARSADAFDAGASEEAKRIATAVRVLVHDTRASTSLLRQLNLKGTLFRDTAVPYNPANVIGSQSLVRMRLTAHPGGKMAAVYEVPRDDRNPGRFVAFDDWWNQVILADGTGMTLTRKDLILGLANQDGGAHVDPELESDYAAFARANAGGWVVRQADGSTEPLEVVERFSARQIAHEVLITLASYR